MPDVQPWGFANRCEVIPAFPIGTYYDGGHRFERDGEIHHSFCTVGSFATHAVVHFSKAVAVPDDVGLDVACLVGCGVPTGVGSAVNTAQVRRGSTCVVYGCGGVGLNVIQGCRLMGRSRNRGCGPAGRQAGSGREVRRHPHRERLRRRSGGRGDGADQRAGGPTTPSRSSAPAPLT